MARFIPAMLIGLTAVGLLIGGVSPAWWITGLAAVGFALVVARRTGPSHRRRLAGLVDHGARGDGRITLGLPE